MGRNAADRFGWHSHPELRRPYRHHEPERVAPAHGPRSNGPGPPPVRLDARVGAGPRAGSGARDVARAPPRALNARLPPRVPPAAAHLNRERRGVGTKERTRDERALQVGRARQRVRIRGGTQMSAKRTPSGCRYRGRNGRPWGCSCDKSLEAAACASDAELEHGQFVLYR